MVAFAPAPSREPESAPRACSTASVEALYRRETAALRAFVMRFMRSAGDAEDIVQDAFVRCWPALADGGIDSPRAFLFRTARNLALNHIRNQRFRNSDIARASIDDAFRRPVVTAEEQFIASEEEAGCQKLLDELPTRCRQAFVLRVVEELSYKEMSEHMNLSVSTIEKHIGKGKQICRSRLIEDRFREDPVLDVLWSRIPSRRSNGVRNAT
ncbi:MAG TPA: RNA polymerase sigma factor [Caulobacteraceae bacterium]|nr:RNA polymerase sigma factor [Caulobacteraceae bacterium]